MNTAQFKIALSLILSAGLVMACAQDRAKVPIVNRGKSQLPGAGKGKTNGTLGDDRLGPQGQKDASEEDSTGRSSGAGVDHLQMQEVIVSATKLPDEKVEERIDQVRKASAILLSDLELGTYRLVRIESSYFTPAPEIRFKGFLSLGLAQAGNLTVASSEFLTDGSSISDLQKTFDPIVIQTQFVVQANESSKSIAFDTKNSATFYVRYHDGSKAGYVLGETLSTEFYPFDYLNKNKDKLDGDTYLGPVRVASQNQAAINTFLRMKRLSENVIALTYTVEVGDQERIRNYHMIYELEKAAAGATNPQ